ncbi:ankyrin repeat-containing domain protein [Rhexocercosporidium sp. MPI-PUGE-AT-0058]|nr:ankyrin repeat-containing domain protein [Rhexocercosporidium sp. MPI-PUGE-AT-0058]
MGRANPNLRDSKGMSPLDMCTEFSGENARREAPMTALNRLRYIQAAFVTLDDVFQPVNLTSGTSSTGLKLGSDITSECQTVGIRQIIRLLIQNGADVSFMGAKDIRKSYSGRRTPLETAIEMDCEVMVDELLSLENLISTNKKPTENKSMLSSETDDPSDDSDDEEDDEEDDEGVWRYYTTWKAFAEKYVAFRSQSSVKLLDGIVEPEKSNLTTFRTLLQTENERGVEEFKRLGADMLRPQWNGESCITLLVKWGYASLLEKFRSETALVTDEWIMETEKIDSNLPGRLSYLLHIACGRSLPNLEVLKSLPLHDINCQSKSDGQTALHILAHTPHWWQSHAMTYLLEQGANPNMKDTSGKTPLFIAVGGFRKDLAVEILLRHGADPNVLDNNGVTCLNLAGSNSPVIQKLIKAGADVSAGSKPFVFDAIAAFDLDTVKLLREMGSDYNVRPAPEKEDDSDENENESRKARRRREKLYYSKTVAEMSYPIHYAASAAFNRSSDKEKMIPIIQELLKGNANPLLTFNEEGDSILHDIFENGGIVEPFLEIQGLDLEVRDSKGKTYLLAACSTADDYSQNYDKEWLVAQPSPAQLLLAKGADISAIDNEGRNIFHHLVRSSARYKNLHASHPADLKRFLAHPEAATLVVQKDAKGATPLHHALRGSQLWAIDPLLASGADPLEADTDGNTALHHLASQFCLPSSYSKPNPLTAPLFGKFLTFGISINTPNIVGETPLFKLISGSGLSMDNLQMFESKGADLTVSDQNGRGLLHAIAKIGDLPVKKDGVEAKAVGMFRYLMGKDLDPMMEDAEQRSSLDVAMASGSVGILEIFKREK